MASGYLSGMMAYRRFAITDVSEERREEPSVVPVKLSPSDSRVLLPWIRYFPAKRTGNDRERYFRKFVLAPEERGRCPHPFYTQRRLGNQRAVKLLGRMTSQHGAGVENVWRREYQGWEWWVRTGPGTKGFASGRCKSSRHGFEKVGAELRRRGAEMYIDPSVDAIRPE